MNTKKEKVKKFVKENWLPLLVISGGIAFEGALICAGVKHAKKMKAEQDKANQIWQEALDRIKEKIASLDWKVGSLTDIDGCDGDMTCIIVNELSVDDIGKVGEEALAKLSNDGVTKDSVVSLVAYFNNQVND